MSQSFQSITGAADIDINRHAVIEASAGTGKTHTMVELVLRLMSDEQSGLALDQILLTTFTENAAVELKTRIRQKLKQTIDDGGLSDIIINRFNKAIQNIESAPIYTIHGFCQRMLTEFAFESGEVFEQTLVDGDRLLESRFNAWLRTWPADEAVQVKFQHYLAADDKHGLSALKRTVLKVAAQYKPDFDVIYPPEPESLPDLNDFSLLADLDELETRFMQLQINKNGGLNANLKKNWQQRVKPVLKTLSDKKKSHTEKLEYIQNLLVKEIKDNNVFLHFFKSNKQIYDHNQWPESQQNHPLICTQLQQIFDLITIIQDDARYRQSAIIKDSLATLDSDVRDFLSQQGQITYDHIIRRLYTRLQAEQQSGQPLLLAAIRRKFSVAMIDEFQDTDPYQWFIFKWLFLQQDAPDQRLWVIGDPKQSIYGFRGADVNTYLRARDSMQQAGACSYRLTTNYRTIAPLINAFNCFFSSVSDPRSTGFWYPTNSIKVVAADRKQHPELPQLTRDHSNLAAFTYVPLDEDNPADARRTELAEQIAETIHSRLIGRLGFSLKGEDKILNYDDICILVKANNDSEFIKKACQARHIPVSIQRSKGLYLQTEAIQFEVILSALHQPQHKARVHNALSTLFFDYAQVNPEQLSEHHKQRLKQQWLQLLQWAKAGQWVALFDWLLNGSGSRLRAEKSGNKRQLANLQKIANTLLHYAMQHHAGIADLLRFYKKLRLTAVELNEDDQNQDTDDQAVKVMTMHGAKGLEFPVVFLFDGLTGPRQNSPYQKFYHEDIQATVYDVSKQSKALQQAAYRKEFKQLYYVAMTRAIFKLFVPYLNMKSKRNYADYQELIIDNIDQCQQADLTADSRPANLTLAAPAGKQLTGEQPESQEPLPFSQAPAHLSARSRFVHSFSSLSQHWVNAGETTELHRYGDIEKPSDEPFQHDQVMVHQPLIPGGVTTGHVLHGIFENVHFKDVWSHDGLQTLWADQVIMAVVDAQMQQFKLSNQRIKAELAEDTEALDYRQQLAAWVWHSLRKPLPMLNGQSLGLIKPEDRRHEMSFHWQHQDRQLTGYIDLLFRINNPQGGHDYFILDWKSNINDAGYEPQVLAETVMQQHHYVLQYQLYATAVDTWFQHLGLNNARLKGALYVFSRGVQCHADDLNGIYYHEFSDLAAQNKRTQQHIMQLTEA